MQYLCREQSIDRETVFAFCHSDWDPNILYIDLHVRRFSDKIKVHQVEIRIVDNIIQWHEYHLREKDPCVTPKARAVVEKTWKNRMFL